jgi:hypothetical protein
MTDYNDGKWHGWNGGECPVHPKSVVVVVTGRGQATEPAGDFGWNDNDTPIVAFRVIKPYIEPREFWVNVYPNGDIGRPHLSKNGAEMCCEPGGTTIQLREVIEE